MPRTCRYIHPNHPYELDLRVREGLPFATLRIISTLIESALARAQRDNKVTLCSNLVMGNHFHQIIIPTDAQQCSNYYQELQKKITEYLKRLLGKKHLSLWEGDPVVAEILDLDKGIDRAAYHYANPAAANLTDTIEQYPGLSSWQAFLEADESVEATVTKTVTWVHQPAIPKLNSLTLTDTQDFALTKRVKNSTKDKHDLTYTPYAWMKCFGIKTPAEVREVKEKIIARTQALEEEARAARSTTGKKVLGANQLKKQPIMAPHTPKPRERRIMVLSTIAKLRVAYINAHKQFSKQCRACYRALRDGLPEIPWPPGAIRPYLRPVTNAIVAITEAIRTGPIDTEPIRADVF